MSDLCEHHADVMDLDQPTKEQKMSNDTPTPINPADTPTPIDPADIRPGDVFRLTQEATCEQIDKRTGDIVSTLGDVFTPVTASRTAWHLVSRPDPDAEAVRAIRSASYNIHHAGERMDPLPGLPEARDLLTKLREQGWDVTRREEAATDG